MPDDHATEKCPARMDIIDVRSGDARKTGVGAIFETDEVTLAAFNSAKRLEVPRERADFLIDYRDDQGDIVDTIPITADGYRQVVGEEPRVPAYNEAYDRAYWASDSRSHPEAHKEATAKADAVMLAQSGTATEAR